MLEKTRAQRVLTAIGAVDRCLTPAQLTTYFPHKAAATIKKDLSRRPDQLPPFFRIGRQTLFRESQVIAWLDKKQQEWEERGKEKVESGSGAVLLPRRGPKRRGGGQ